MVFAEVKNNSLATAMSLDKSLSPQEQSLEIGTLLSPGTAHDTHRAESLLEFHQKGAQETGTPSLQSKLYNSAAELVWDLTQPGLENASVDMKTSVAAANRRPDPSLDDPFAEIMKNVHASSIRRIAA